MKIMNDIDKILSSPKSMDELNLKHENKGRPALYKFLRELKNKLGYDLVSVKIEDEENDLKGGPTFRVTLSGSVSKINQATPTLKSIMDKIGYELFNSKSTWDSLEFVFVLRDNTPISDGKIYKSVTHGDIRDIKVDSGSDAFTAEVAAILISQMLDSRATASQELRYLMNGDHTFDFGQDEMTASEQSKFQSALYQFYKLLERKGF